MAHFVAYTFHHFHLFPFLEDHLIIRVRKWLGSPPNFKSDLYVICKMGPISPFSLGVDPPNFTPAKLNSRFTWSHDGFSKAGISKLEKGRIQNLRVNQPLNFGGVGIPSMYPSSLRTKSRGILPVSPQNSGGIHRGIHLDGLTQSLRLTPHGGRGWWCAHDFYVVDVYIPENEPPVHPKNGEKSGVDTRLWWYMIW